MKRTVSVIARGASGGLMLPLDRVAIDCDDEHTGIEQVLAAHKDAGAQSVLILLEDDSIARHWTRPAGDAVAPARAAAPRATAKRQVKRKGKR